MAAWLCTVCSTVFSVGAPRCPHCGSTQHVEEGQQMPKITRHGGPSIAGASVVAGGWSSEGDPDVWPEPATEEGGEEPSAGSSSSTSDEKPSTEPEKKQGSRRKPARTTASRSTKAPTGSPSARSTDGDPEDGTSAADTSSK